MSKIVLTPEEKNCLMPYIVNKGLTEFAFMKATELCEIAQSELVDKVKEIWPNSVGLQHPKKGKWTVTLCDKEKEPKVLPGKQKKTKKE